MDSLYDTTLDMHGGVVHSSAWRVLKETMLRNLTQTVDFYHNHGMAVASEHFLVRLLHSIDVPMTMPTERYIANVESMCLKLSMALKMTSSIYRGQIFDGVFYGEGSQELLIAWQSDHRPNDLDAIEDWRSVVPIRVIRHPLTSMNLQLPDGTPRLTRPDFSVFLIDLPLLAWQYRQFRMNEVKIQVDEGGNQRSTQQFVHMFVLPNMLGSQLDIAIFNRYRYQMNQWPMEKETFSPHSFQLLQYNDKIDTYIANHLKVLTASPRDFTGIMKSILVVAQDTLFDVAQLPKLPPTQQVMWATSLAQLPLILFLFTFDQRHPETKNRSAVNHILRNIRYYNRNSVMKAFPPNVRSLVTNDLETIQAYRH